MLFLFPNVHKVMKADRICSENGVSCRVIPVPEYISSECGMCLVVENEKAEWVKALLEKNNIQFDVHKQEDK